MFTTPRRRASVRLGTRSVPMLFRTAIGATLLAGSAGARPCDPIQIEKLVGSSGQDSYFGYSVAISADGATAIAGACGESNRTGAAYVFVRNDGDWVQQGPPLIAADSSGQFPVFGIAVALSADGDTALVGASGDGGEGAVRVFVRADGAWSQQGLKLVPTGGVGNGQFGGSLSLSADGNTAVVGAPNDSDGVGAAYIFARSSGAWAQQGSKLVPGGNRACHFGASVAMSGDGLTAIIGAPNDVAFDSGSAVVFSRSEPSWTQDGPKLVPNDAFGAGRFGSAVTLNADGTWAGVGAPLDNPSGQHDLGVGAAYVFVRTAGVWNQQAPKLLPTGAAGRGNFGVSVSMGADSTALLVGAYADNDYIGASYQFVRAGQSWSQHGSKLVPIGGIGSASYYGYSLALSADGDTAFVGAYLDNLPAATGAGYVIGIGSAVSLNQQPASAAACFGGIAALSIEASSTRPVLYQWRRGGNQLQDGPTGAGSVLSGAASATLMISNAGSSDAGQYDCLVSNGCEQVLSEPAAVAVGLAGDLTQNNVVNTQDLTILLAYFGSAAAAEHGDIDQNGIVNTADLTTLLGAFGQTCP